jgi:hypothetical protein
MERNSDWKVPAALILAGLSLLVALSGRNFFSFSDGPQNAQSIVISAEPGGQPPFPVDPNDPGGQSNSAPKGGFVPVMPGIPQGPDIQKIPVPPDGALNDLRGKLQDLKGRLQDSKQFGYSFGGSSDPVQGVWDYIQGLIAYLSPLMQLAALGLLIWLGYGYLTRRNRPLPTYVASSPSTPPRGSPIAPDHGDITRPESNPGG